MGNYRDLLVKRLGTRVGLPGFEPLLIWSQALPHKTSTQKAELITLTEALRWEKRGWEITYQNDRVLGQTRKRPIFTLFFSPIKMAVSCGSSDSRGKIITSVGLIPTPEL